MASSDQVLLKNGLLLVHDDKGHVVPRHADLLMREGIIRSIQENIPIPENSRDTTVIDCEGKIISPGFVNTHHHVWQTQLKGRHGNHTLLEYLPSGCFIGALYTAEDAFWGELGGAMEAIDAGTTTTVDHSHLAFGHDYSLAMIKALVTSGIRAVFCGCMPRKLQSLDPIATTDDYTLSGLDEWKNLAKRGPFADGRVQLGFAFDNVYLPAPQLQAIYAELRASKAKLITSHSAGGVAFNNPPSVVQLLQKAGLLGPDILISHATFPKQGDAALVTESGAFISSTPNTELQMGSPPIGLLPEFEGQASLGADCHTWGTGFMPYQMRMMLQHARTARAEKLAAEGKWSRHVYPTVEQAFNLGTIRGARAVGMDGEIGQIKVGARSDLVIFSTTSPSMLAAAQEDPLAAVVLHSSERDIEMVFVDGVLRKSRGALTPVSVVEVAGSEDSGRSLPVGETVLDWNHVVKEILESRRRIKEKSAGLDWVGAENRIVETMFLNKEAMIEKE